MHSAHNNHQAILPGADMSYPLTLGIVRERPCRELADIAIERFGALGLWRNPTPETIQCAIAVYMLSRSKFILSLQEDDC